jgi:hypothetical protein
MTYRLLTVRVNVFGDPSEGKTLSFLWFRQSKTLFEFYAGQKSLCSCRKNIAWFPSEMTRETIFAFFQRFAGSLLMQYISEPSHIETWMFRDYGLSQWSYMDTFADTEMTRMQLAANIAVKIYNAAQRIQKAWRFHFLKSL